MSDDNSTPQSAETPPPVGFGGRLILALVLPWKLLFDGLLAGRVSHAQTPPLALPATPDPAVQAARDEAVAVAEQAKAGVEVAQRAVDSAQKKIESLEKELAASNAERAEQAAVLDKRNDPDGALHLLRIFQRDGRLVDFLREDVAGFGDADIGAAARLVHEGCRKAVDEYFTLARVRTEDEDTAIVIEDGFDAQRIRLTGNVSGDAPYKGSLAHAGWVATDVRLPSLPPEQDPAVIAPAEVEL